MKAPKSFTKPKGKTASIEQPSSEDLFNPSFDLNIDNS